MDETTSILLTTALTAVFLGITFYILYKKHVLLPPDSTPRQRAYMTHKEEDAQEADNPTY